MKRKIISALFAAIVTAQLFTVGGGALKLAYTPTGVYKNSIYYERLLSVELTGDERRDIVLTAISQLGYHEGNSQADFNGKNQSGNKNYVEYNYANRSTYSAGGTYSYAWCASFVTWCARQSGISTSVVINSVSCDNFVSYFMGRSEYKTRSSGYRPIAGDLIFYKSPNADRIYASHIGIVVGTDRSYVYAIEGNTARGLVNYRRYSMNDTYIVGYAVPSYSGVKGDYSDFELKSGYVEEGTHTVTASSLNFRAEPATSGAKIGSIPNGAVLTINECSGDWGKTQYGGKEGWVHLDYVRSTGVKQYKVSYDANGGKDAPSSVLKSKGVRLYLSESAPRRDGHVFLGWAETPSANLATYAPGEAYDIDKSVTLYAVWKPIDVKIEFADHDGRVISSKIYPYGETVEVPDAPTREADEKYEYSFLGWDKTVNETAIYDRVYTAVYTKTEVTSADGADDETNSPLETEKVDDADSAERKFRDALPFTDSAALVFLLFTATVAILIIKKKI